MHLQPCILQCVTQCYVCDAPSAIYFLECYKVLYLWCTFSFVFYSVYVCDAPSAMYLTVWYEGLCLYCSDHANCSFWGERGNFHQEKLFGPVEWTILHDAKFIVYVLVVPLSKIAPSNKISCSFSESCPFIPGVTTFCNSKETEGQLSESKQQYGHDASLLRDSSCICQMLWRSSEPPTGSIFILKLGRCQHNFWGIIIKGRNGGWKNVGQKFWGAQLFWSTYFRDLFFFVNIFYWF